METAATSRQVEDAKARNVFARIHVAMGLAAVVLFLATGIYMRTQETFLLPDGVRLLYRSRHIYLLLSALLNLLVGIHYRAGASGKTIRSIGSTLILIAPPSLFAAFFLDSPRALLTHIGIYSIAAGSVLLAWVNRKA
jgi:uncharacterized membrane protein